MAITADGSAPLAARTDRAIVLDFVDEQSLVQTRFATTVLALIRAHIGQSLDLAAADARGRARGAAARSARGRRRFLGTGWRVGLAREAALKVREAAALPSEAHPRWSSATGRSAPRAGRRSSGRSGRSPALAADVERTGATARALEP